MSEARAMASCRLPRFQLPWFAAGRARASSPGSLGGRMFIWYRGRYGSNQPGSQVSAGRPGRAVSDSGRLPDPSSPCRPMGSRSPASRWRYKAWQRLMASRDERWSGASPQLAQPITRASGSPAVARLRPLAAASPAASVHRAPTASGSSTPGRSARGSKVFDPIARDTRRQDGHEGHGRWRYRAAVGCGRERLPRPGPRFSAACQAPRPLHCSSFGARL